MTAQTFDCRNAWADAMAEAARADERVVAVLPHARTAALTFGFQNADNLDRHAVHTDALTDDIAIGEEVGRGGLADHDHSRAALSFLFCELASLIDLPVVDLEE